MINIPNKYIGAWNLKQLYQGELGQPNHGLKVFSCFSCGGGSSMGYKLAGFNVLGYCEIDHKMANIYNINLNPKLKFVMPIQQFKNSPLITKEEAQLYNLDVLDGSPPCSSFSMAGNREKDWSKKKKFREGQSEQVLDDLFFHFIDVAKWLRPKIVIAENVKGLIQGNARGYVKQIFSEFSKAEYEVQLFLLNSSRMGVPQSRERTFFIARRKDLNLRKIEFNFNEKIISVKESFKDIKDNDNGKLLNNEFKKYWENTPIGKTLSYAHPKGNLFMWSKISYAGPACTVVAGPAQLHPLEPRHLSNKETIRLQTFPDDYNFLDQDVRYVCGMSVPPFMMQRIALEVAKILL